MEYLIATLFLLASLLVYFKIANKYNIIDKPNERSAHSIPTLRGGGIVFWVAFLLIFIQTFPANLHLFLAITIVATVSFIDDITPLPNKIRLLAHFGAIALIFESLHVFQDFPIWAIIIAFIIFVGIINAYNFMDGINGMTGCYTTTVCLSLLYINTYVLQFTFNNLIIYPIIASLIFLFFNFRKRAKCFAGDIGSISIAFWMVYLLLQLMLKTQSIIWILLIAIYGVETSCTILHRLYLKQNIFKAHRYHYYQLLANNLKLDHRVVSVIYAFLQILITATVIYLYLNNAKFLYYIAIISLLLMMYTTKFIIMKKNNITIP